MKILLIQPSVTDKGHIHLGLGFIAASLEQKSHEVSIIDLSIEGKSLKGLRNLIIQTKPDAVGIATLTPTYPTVKMIAGLVKEIDDKCTIILGGTHASVLTDEVIGEPAVDVVIRGEGEITAVELVDALEKGKGLSDIFGISYKNNGKIIHNPDRSLIENLDNLPPIPWHLFQLEKYTGNINGKRAVGISAARGCPFNCVFCYRGPAAGKKIRSWSPERVLREVKYVREKYGITGFHFWNDVFTYNKQWVIALCDLIKKEDLNIEWDCQTRADLINEEVLEKMKAAGCRAVMLGVESGSDEILKKIDKNLTKEQIYYAFQLLDKAGFETTATFTLGLPWDTKETIQETIEFAKHLNPDFGMFYVATPFPGSPLWNMCQDKGIPLSRDWAGYRILPFEVDINKMVPVFDTSKLSKETLERFLKTAQIEFQLGRLRGGRRNLKKGIMNIIEIFLLIFRRSKSLRQMGKLLLRICEDFFIFLKYKSSSKLEAFLNRYSRIKIK